MLLLGAALWGPIVSNVEHPTYTVAERRGNVRFIMPSKYTMETLPKPNNPAVELKEIPAKRFAAIRFSGMAGEDSLKRHAKELEDFLSAKTLRPLSPPTYAFYNPPWTLPFLRRNEVLVEIPASSP